MHPQSNIRGNFDGGLVATLMLKSSWAIAVMPLLLFAASSVREPFGGRDGVAPPTACLLLAAWGRAAL